MADGELVRKMLKALVEIEDAANQAAKRQADDEQNGIIALGHILHNGIDAKAGGGHAHSGKERRLVLFFDAFFECASDNASGNDGCGIDDCTQHGRRAPFCVLFGRDVRSWTIYMIFYCGKVKVSTCMRRLDRRESAKRWAIGIANVWILNTDMRVSRARPLPAFSVFKHKRQIFSERCKAQSPCD